MFKNDKGGVALEYILVTSFAAFGSTIVLGILLTLAKQKVTPLAEKHGISVDFTDLDFFKNP